MKILNRISLVALFISSFPVLAGDQAELNSIYQLFMQDQVDIQQVEQIYPNDIIHVGPADSPLIMGRDSFLKINIEPFISMIAAEGIKLELTAFVVRRTIGKVLANDVGYLYGRLHMPGKEPIQQVQKYSWVFQRDKDSWKVITDFDSTLAPLEVLSDIKTVEIIGEARPDL